VIVRRTLAAGVAIAIAGCCAGPALAKPKPLDRPEDPVVLTGAQLPRLLGIAPEELTAYSYVPSKLKGKAGKKAVASKRRKARRFRWARVPVQVDERALIDFGSQPPSNATPPTGASTVYGTNPIGVTALQYTDPGTFVGADPNPALDGDDEVALISGDAGGKAPRRGGGPSKVTKTGATALTVTDPLTGGKGWIYLFRAKGKPKALKADYVDYEFRLLSGDYKSTYRRADGPNPEASTVTTAEYRAGYSDRWFLDTLAFDAGAAGGQDILDGLKSGFAPGNCGRSEATYNDAEGAFIANRDGPVRAIRSYLGANSGPLTQRTDVFYAGRHEARIDLRVHAIGSIFSYVDLSPAAFGMTYRNPAVPGGVAVNGVNDAVGSSPALWHLWSGSQGSLFSSNRLTTSIGAAIAAGTTTGFYRDELNTGIQQCWGDDDLIGAAGTHITPAGGLPNTDPRNQPAATFHAETVNLLSAPGADATEAGSWSNQIGSPLSASAKRFKVKERR